MTKFYAPDDEDCTIEEVNEALKEAGLDDVDLYYDSNNDDNITISHRCYDSNGHVYYQDQSTGLANPYMVALRFERGSYCQHD